MAIGIVQHYHNPMIIRSNRLELLVCRVVAPLIFSSHLLFGAESVSATQATSTPPPNILFILADDHAWQALSAYGDSRHLIETPNIDRIAKEGMKFAHCLVNNSLCGPSRASILTGTYSHINGFYNNSNCRFDGSQITFPKLLQQAGYQTAMIGKWHLETDPTGFDHWEILPGQGVYYNPTMIRNGEKIKHPGYVTDIITDLSLDWLKSINTNKPFLLLCWQKAPHRPCEPPLNDLDFDHDRIYDQPSTLFDDYSGRGLAERDQEMTIAKKMQMKSDCMLVAPKGLTPDQAKIWKAYFDPRNEAFKNQKLSGKELTSWKYNRYLHDYLACIRGLDDNIGRILNYLDKSGLASNTIVVYSSDQGFFLGEHGWFDKRWIFQESARTPLLIRWPGTVKPGSVNKDLVSNNDLAETLLQIAGLPIPERMQGRSLVPLLQGLTPDDWRKAFYYHYYEWPFDHHVRPHYGVITDRYTLVHFYYPDVDYWELFDRAKDPEEMKSVFGDPAYAQVQSDLMKEVDRQRKEVKEPDKVDPKAYGGKNND
jgi:arylsulfatase A-like enzyme